jgi:FtsH-binding integral membrane protein
MIITGGILLVLSVVVSGLQVAKVLPSYFILSILSFLCLIGGVFIGMMGIFTYVKKARDAYHSGDPYRYITQRKN